MDLDEPTQLVPVSQWVYDLYKVTYWTGGPDVAGSRIIRTGSITASSEGHMQSEAWENAPSYAELLLQQSNTPATLHNMSTQQQNEIKIGNIIKQMIASGVPRSQAVAVGMAMEHALTCPEYQVAYGSFLVEELQIFVDEVKL